MPPWSNTEAPIAKPKFDVERQTREYIQLSVLTGNNAGNTVITVSYNDGFQNNVANIGVASGQYVYFWANGTGLNGGQAGNGVPGMFFSNTTVSSTSGNTVTLSNPLFNNVSAGFIIEFDKAISYKSGTQATTYNRDTILITQTRAANNSTNLPTGITAAQLGNFNAGWNHIQKKTNSDGTVRYLRETLVALANPVASNTSSANTSFGNFLAGL